MKITMKRFLLMAGLFLGLAFTLNAAEMASPNGVIKVNFELNNGVPTYSVTFRGKMMIKPADWVTSFRELKTCSTALHFWVRRQPDKMKPGSRYGVKTARFAIITPNFW